MRAKMTINCIERYDTSPNEALHFNAVGLKASYPADGSDENNTFARFTPTAVLSIQIANPALLGKFEVGQSFYVDFSPASSA